MEEGSDRLFRASLGTRGRRGRSPLLPAPRIDESNGHLLASSPSVVRVRWLDGGDCSEAIFFGAEMFANTALIRPTVNMASYPFAVCGGVMRCRTSQADVRG